MINVLVFENSKYESDIFETIKKLENISLHKSNKFDEIFSILKVVKVDLILIDFDILAKDDFEVIKEIKSNPKYKIIHICILTNRDLDSNFISLAYDNGVDDNLIRPLNSSKLRNKIKKIRDVKSLRCDSIFCDIDLFGRFDFISEKFLELTLYTFDELIESSILKRTDKMTGKRIINILHDLAYGEKNSEIIKLYKKDGSICYFETHISHLGESGLFRFLFHDVTNRLYLSKKIKVALNAQNSITAFTDGDKVLDISDEFFRNFPFEDLEDFLSKHSCLCDLFVEKDENIPHLMPMMGDITWIDYILKNEHDFFNAYMIDKEGHERVYEVSIIEKIEFANILKEYIIVFNDITKVKELLVKNEKSQIDFLQQANTLCDMQLRLEKSLHNEQNLRKLKDQFFANMSHEIRTPLGGIVSSLELLNNTHLDSNQQEFMDICVSSSQYLLSLIEDILDMNKIQSDRFKLNYEECDILEELDTIYKLFNLKANEKNIYLKFVLDRNIPKFITCDIKRLKQILINLISNSIKFTTKGGVTLKVKVKNCFKNDVTLLFQVIDTGRGIDESKLATIFDPYSQESSDTYTKFGGTGLGTAIVKQLINQFNGKISISSKLSIGTTVTCEIPFKVLNELKSKKLEKNVFNKFNGEYILIAEDNLTNQSLIKSILKQFDLKVEVTNNGDEVFKEYMKNSTKYKVVLMDINMPIKNGFIATCDIRNYEKQYLRNVIPIVALTANIMTNDKEKLAEIGINDYLTKPINKALLNNILTKYIKPTKKESDIKKESEKVVSTYSIEEVSKYFDVPQESMKEILKDFFMDLDSQLKTAQEYVEVENYESLNLVLHSMKGSTAELQLDELNKEIKIQEAFSKTKQKVNLTDILKIKNFLQRDLGL